MRIVIIIILIILTLFVLLRSLSKGQKFETFTFPFLLTLIIILTGFEGSHQYHNEQLSQVVKAVSKNDEGHAKCQRLTETFFDTESRISGKVEWTEPNKAVLKYRECQQALSWLNQGNKNEATLDQIRGMGVLIHESYHVAGEKDERITECLNITNMENIFMQLGSSPEAAHKMKQEYVEKVYKNMPEEYKDVTCPLGETNDGSNEN